MPDAPYFHDASGTVRFWVPVDDGNAVSASIGREALRYHFRTAEGADSLATFGLHVQEIEAAVRRRLAQGAAEPVMLREHDMRGAAG
ncbi:DUF1488 family protein [Variovorax sp. J22G73]|uniref:DUF1488 family protein n=1 Tax=unclassified Variovorax TaxID=663243 RepID=UPI000E32CAC2|nr:MULTISPECIES: DUF1488 family protein [unclassified Variovorax]MDM0004924.1 DUF1488 family protein [Variovorax sp. J22R203]MDM0098340.1 DUF1488 family protein [Variovorax sp. J22G73]